MPRTYRRKARRTYLAVAKQRRVSPGVLRNRTVQARPGQQDAEERNAIEGKFGEGKRVYGLGLIRARLRTAGETVIALQLLVMNLERRLRILLCTFFGWLFRSVPLAVFADP